MNGFLIYQSILILRENYHNLDTVVITYVDAVIVDIGLLAYLEWRIEQLILKSTAYKATSAALWTHVGSNSQLINQMEEVANPFLS